MVEIVKVTRKFQVTIPKRVRERVGVRVGDRLAVSERGGLIILRKVGEGRLSEFAGAWGGYPEDLNEFMRELRRLWAKWKIEGSASTPTSS